MAAKKRKAVANVARIGSIAAMAGAGALASTASATDLYWGQGGTTTNNWTTAGNWYTDTGETTASGATPTVNDDVFFNTTGDNELGSTVLMAGNIAARSITFNTTGTTTVSQGSNSRVLTLGAGGITVNSGAGTSNIATSTSALVGSDDGQSVMDEQLDGHPDCPLAACVGYGDRACNVDTKCRQQRGIAFALGTQDSPNGNNALSIIVDSASTGTVSMAGSTYTGGTTVQRGILSASGTLGTGGITVGVASIANEARFNTSGVLANNITVTSGTGLRALTGSGSGGNYQGNIVLQVDVSLGSVSGGAVNVIYSGAISGTGTVTIGRIATGTINPTVTITGSNTYTSKTNVASASLSVLSLNSVVGGTASSSLGAPVTVENGTISLGAVSTTTLRYLGTGETTDRVLDMAGTTIGVNLEQAGTGLLKFTSDLATSGIGQKTLTFQGSTEGNGEFAGVIANSAVGSNTIVVKGGTGTWRLSGLNTYTGTTSIGPASSNAGVLEVTVLANGGLASSIGASTNATNSLVFGGSQAGGGTLRYVGLGGSTDRGFSVGGVGAQFDSSGSGAINWTSTAAPNIISANSRTITLKGTNTGLNTFAAAFGNPSAGDISFLKEGAGTWVLSGTNTYRGDNTINGGTLRTSSNTGLGFGGAHALNGALGTTQVNATGTVELGGGVTVNEVIALNGGSLINSTAATTATLNNGVAGITFSNAGAGYSGTITVAIAGGATATATQTGGLITGITTTAAGSGYTAAPTVTINGTGGGSGSATATAILSSLTLSGTANNIGGAGDLTIAASIGGSGGGFTKTGTGTVLLSATNTYTGATVVNNGRLAVSGNLGSSNVTVQEDGTLELRTNSSVSDLSTVTLETGSQVDLKFSSGNELVNTLVINGTVFSAPTIFNADNGYNGFASYFTSDGGGLQVVPEPASIGLLAMASMGLLARRRRNPRIATE